MSKRDLYDYILPDHKPKRDWQAPALAVFGVVLLLAISTLIFMLGRAQYRFNEFSRALARSTEYAAHMNSFVLYDGEIVVERGGASQILRVIIDARAGRERRDIPEDREGLTCVYGDGCVLRMWETEVTDRSSGHGKEMVPGTLVAFTDENGKVYAYETKNIDYPNLRLYLIGEADAYYAPYLPDLIPLLERRPFQR